MPISLPFLVAGRSSPILFTTILMLVFFAVSVSVQQSSPEKEWNDILAAAKKEGKVVVANSPDSVMREISTRFKARFGITLEHIAGRSGRNCDTAEIRATRGAAHRGYVHARDGSRGAGPLS
jgi:tripartite-type tricarboxylate transporter receptor subunit TctC